MINVYSYKDMRIWKPFEVEKSFPYLYSKCLNFNLLNSISTMIFKNFTLFNIILLNDAINDIILMQNYNYRFRASSSNMFVVNNLTVSYLVPFNCPPV